MSRVLAALHGDMGPKKFLHKEIIIAAFALRVLHFFRTRNEDKELQKSYKV